MRVEDDAARQGRTGRPVFWVLIGSLLLLAVSGAGLMMWIGSDAERTPTQAASESAVGAPSATGSTSARTPSANPAYPVATETRDVNQPGATQQNR
jgi:flagellar basal body-associated protein FliL